MKRITLILFTFITFISFNTCVRAADAISIMFVSDDEYQVRDNNWNIISDENIISEYFTFDNDVFTLKEGKYFDFIGFGPEKDITLTSNGKKVYINLIDGYYSGIILDNLNYENFIHEDINNVIYYGIETYRKLKIINSNIILNNKDSSKYDIRNFSSENVEITNSTIKTEYGITSKNSDLYLNNSNIEAKGFNVNSSTNVMNVIAEDSTINFIGNNLSLSNNTYYLNDLSYFESLEMKNSKLNANNVWINNQLKTSNSEINIKGLLEVPSYIENDSTFYLNGIAYIDDLKMDNSKILSTNESVINLISENIYMNDSIIDIGGPLSASLIDMDNSNLTTRSNDKKINEVKIVERYIPLKVDTLKINNSNFTAISSNNLPAYLSLNNIISSKDIKIFDDNEQILNYKTVNKTVDELTLEAGLSIEINNGFYSDDYNDTSKTLYTFYNNDKMSNYVTTIEPVKETKPINNPKTGVKSLILVFYLTIICIALVLKKNKETSYFKRRI